MVSVQSSDTNLKFKYAMHRDFETSFKSLTSTQWRCKVGKQQKGKAISFKNALSGDVDEMCMCSELHVRNYKFVLFEHFKHHSTGKRFFLILTKRLLISPRPLPSMSAPGKSPMLSSNAKMILEIACG